MGADQSGIKRSIVPARERTAMATYVTDAAKQGHSEQGYDYCNPYLASSPNGMAYDVGRWLRRNWHHNFARVRMSRGYALIAEFRDGSTLKLEWLGRDHVKCIGHA